MPLIYHVTTGDEWKTALKMGFYESASLRQEGFIHCSQEEQLEAVLERYFSGRKGLVRLGIDTDKLNSKYVFEWSPGTQDTFPHIYGPVNMEAIVSVLEL